MKYKKWCTLCKLRHHAEKSSLSFSSLVSVFAANLLPRTATLSNLSPPCPPLRTFEIGVLGASELFRFLGVEGADPDPEFLTAFRIFPMRSLIARAVGTSPSFARLLLKREFKIAAKNRTYARHPY